MPTWLTPALKWGGLALAVVSAAAVIYVEIYLETIAPIPEGGETSAPEALYWVLLAVGVVATIAGFILDRRKGSSTS